jgi:hypothetical protein
MRWHSAKREVSQWFGARSLDDIYSLAALLHSLSVEALGSL